MVSRCCKADIYIEAGEEYYYCCARCGLRCSVIVLPKEDENENDRGE